jgi:hypothetical protein
MDANGFHTNRETSEGEKGSGRKKEKSHCVLKVPSFFFRLDPFFTVMRRYLPYETARAPGKLIVQQ